jgi:hypothetical protein
MFHYQLKYSTYQTTEKSIDQTPAAEPILDDQFPYIEAAMSPPVDEEKVNNLNL